MGSKGSAVAPGVFSVRVNGNAGITVAFANLSFAGGWRIEMAEGSELPPPGAGLNTVTWAVPTIATSLAGISAVKKTPALK